MNSIKIFETTKPVKLFFMAAVPGALSMLASSLYYLIDAALVGAFLGETAFAALNFVMPFIIINFSVGDLVGVGAAVPISIALGRRDEKKANNIFSGAAVIIIISGAVIGGAMFAFAPALVRFMGAEGELARQAVEYMRVYAAFSPLTTLTYAMDNFLKICGKIRYSLWINIFMAVISTSLEVVFLAVFDLGIGFSAAASSIGMIFCTTAAIIPFLSGKLQLRFTAPKINGDMLRQIAAFGTPTFLNNIAGRTVSVLMNYLLMRRGGENAVSVYGVLMNINGFFHSLIYGLCDALQPATGYNWGAKKYERLKALERCSFSGAAVVALFSAVIVFLFPRQLSLFFVSSASDEFLALCVPAVRILSFSCIFGWACFAAQSYLLAIERNAFATALSVCNVFAFPLICLLPLWNLGLTGIWLNILTTALLSFALSFIFVFIITKDINRRIASNEKQEINTF